MPNESDLLTYRPKWSNILASGFVIIFLIFSSYFCRGYIHSILRWVESQPDPIVFSILVVLYILVSLPIAWGYIVINAATGYLYGLQMGILVTFISATLGIIFAHYMIKTFLVKHVERLIDTAEPNSMLKKLSFLLDSNQDAFQLVLLSRLTPIPFGLQNSLFAVSTMSFDKYLQATCLGLFPCQIINVYLGSTLRSMEEVFGDANAARVGLIVLSCQLFICVLVVMFVTQKAKKQLDLAITSQKKLKELQFPPLNKLDIVVIPKSDQKFEAHRKTLSL